MWQKQPCGSFTNAACSIFQVVSAPCPVVASLHNRSAWPVHANCVWGLHWQANRFGGRIVAKDANASQGVNGSRELTLTERLANQALVGAALNKAAREAVLNHARAGNPVSTLRDGKVVWLQPEEVFAFIEEMDKKLLKTT
jgi:hypothetical protein